MKFAITHKITGAVVFALECGSLKLCVEAAVRSGADLRSAYLRSADLRSADLRSADLRSADLEGADLRSADLRSADLGGADLEGADLRSANLEGADLRSADLGGADLGGADLRSANLRGAYLETGETLAEYISHVMPTLLMAGGKAIEEVATAWDCHSWDNCPMAVAFSCHTISSVPILLRPRVEQFIHLFDAGLLPKPGSGPTSARAAD